MLTPELQTLAHIRTDRTLTTRTIMATKIYGAEDARTRLPELLDRAGWRGTQTDEPALQRAIAKIRELVARYEKPFVDEAALRELRGVVARAREALC